MLLIETNGWLLICLYDNPGLKKTHILKRALANTINNVYRQMFFILCF